MTRIIILLIASFSLSNSAFAEEPYSKELCRNHQYTCIKVKRGDTWDRLFPDHRTQDIIRRINRTNLALTPGMTIALPNEMDKLDPIMFAPFPVRITPFDRTVIIIDKSDHAFAAYDTFGSLVYWGPVSTGKDYCPDVGRGCKTPNGTYFMQSKKGAACFSTKYPVGKGGAPMPFCMYFHGGYAMHASAEVPGYNASHGCVRLFYQDAEWLNKNFVSIDGNKSTEVIVRE